MVQLQISLLGPFQVALDGHAVRDLTSTRARALLAYLVVECDRVHPRETLAGLLWPDFQHTSALTNLRHALAHLRRCIDGAQAEPPFFLVSREAIRFSSASDHHLDVTTLLRAVDALRRGEPQWEALEQAVALYRGPFLEGSSVDSAPYEQWVTLQRERLERIALEGLGALAGHCEEEGDYAGAAAHARRQVELEPTREEGQRQLMRALALRGERSAALAQYEACRGVLAEELRVEPAAETSALYEQIRVGAIVARVRAPESPLHPVPDLHEIAESGPGELGTHPPFVAREEELARLDRWLGEALHGLGRVGFVLGEPGSGKTMLVQEFARRAMEAYPELIVAGGTCDAYTGSGDPYLPFREILEMLAGDVQGRLAAGALRGEHARRLRALIPATAGAFLERGADLIDLLVSGEGLLARLEQGSPCRVQLEQLLRKKTAAPVAGGPSPAALLEQGAQVLRTLAGDHPLLLVLDDLQWADTGSVNLLFHLARRLAGGQGMSGSRILILGAYRPAEVALGRDGDRHPLEPVLGELRRLWGEIAVDLSQANGRRLVEALVDGEPNRLGARFRETLYGHTGGHALFTVELLQSLREGGGLEQDNSGRWIEGRGLDWERLPPRVEAVIGQRIGRLSAEEQRMLAVASVEGEEFHAEVLAWVLGLAEGTVIRLLSGPLCVRHRLVTATTVDGWRGKRLSRYRFRHHLFQHYLYGRLDEVERSHLHEQVGLALESVYGPYPGTGSLSELFAWVMELPEELGDWVTSPQWAVTPQLARHFGIAGMTARALGYLWHAMWWSFWLENFDQTLVYMSQILHLTAELPDSVEKLSLECCAQGKLGAIWMVSSSYIAPEVHQAYLRMYELAQRLGRPGLLADAQAGLAAYYGMRGELHTARAYDQRAQQVRRKHGLSMPESNAELMLLLFGGEPAKYCRRLERLYAPLLETPLRLGGLRFLADCTRLGHVTWVLWVLGYPDRALRVGQGALAMACASGTPLGIATILSDGTCFLGQLLGEVVSTAEAVARLVSLNRQLSRPYITAHATLYQGWVQVQQGEGEQGIETLRQGLGQWAQNHLVMLPYWKGFLAEALARAGRVNEGLAVLEEAREQAERGGEMWCLPEVYRLQGELLLQREGPHPSVRTRTPPFSHAKPWEKGDETEAVASCGAPADEAGSCFREAEARFRHAIAVAQKQETKSWELRATTSLARLLRERGRVGEAREMLAAIYGWFTEGFDTPDLQEARALLEELAG